ncbi:MAG: hypothetical protein K5798_02000 [Nitrosopumilus sp.]|uniref:hypothetical protein n=1 Tax=Nitrosopumilus sp. TaxID=2024843 RepID=UPI00242BDFCC|nr:hypothetical protein [Nitrosopumilus sp.]MCV0366022.1 hypothetical protein [Nitrosopumilus sp.]
MTNLLGLFPKANEIAIFVYAGALYFFMIYVMLNNIVIESTLAIGVFGFILVLLLYRYFHEIKFGGLSMKKSVIDNDNKFELFKSSSSSVIQDLRMELDLLKASAGKTIFDLRNEFDMYRESATEEILELKKKALVRETENNKKDEVIDKSED